MKSFRTFCESDGPAYEHDCDQCKFVGQDHPRGNTETRANTIDMYVHHDPKGNHTLIRRWSSTPSEYSAWKKSYVDKGDDKWHAVLDAHKKHIAEGLRTTERAHAVLDRVARMKKFHTKPYANGRWKDTTIKTANHVEDEPKDAWKMAVHKRKYQPEVRRVAIKHLDTNQRGVSVSGVKDKLNKTGLGDKGNPQAFHDHETGRYHVWNGNHRIMAARLKGETHIDMDVWHKDSQRIK